MKKQTATKRLEVITLRVDEKLKAYLQSQPNKSKLIRELVIADAQAKGVAL